MSIKTYDYLVKNYKTNEPIFLYDLKIKGKSENAIKLDIQKLYKEDKIEKYDRGIYYLFEDNKFGKSSPSLYDIIEKKYLIDNNGSIIGYLTDINFANSINLSTQRPTTYFIRSNKATKNIEYKKINDFIITIKKPRTKITNDNYKVLQLLDLLTDIYLIEDDYLPNIKNTIKNYMIDNNIKSSDIKKYINRYPTVIYKNMFDRGIIDVAI